ncbi:MAG: hypothetical protein HPY69_14825 [Armatimonadetes bacterium]|nr:hypothetical protein [Armatimonadota bacterium]
MNDRDAISKWVWVELIGFDNESPDYGVRHYLDTAGFTPELVSLLLFNPDFVHAHDGMAVERALPFDCASYGGHPYGADRQRQDWTSWQLRGLVRELQAQGIAVYFALFDQFASDEWLGRHPELWHRNRHGQLMRSVCPLKHLSDGTLYEDFFAAKLGEVLADYGFDGFHQADGYCHPRLPVFEGDFSDDVVAQFAATGATLPDDLVAPSGDAPEVISRRAEWIWRHARREWIAFYARRMAEFTGKVCAAAHARGKRVVPNNALTRDPFEGLYRYGVDYRQMAASGVDGYILETVAPGVSIGAESGMEADPHYDFLAMVLLMRAYLPGVELHCLNNAHDVNEQWDVLRHGPSLLEREIYCNANLYQWQSDGSLQRCSAGPMVCLADGIKPHEWEWLRQWWGLGFGPLPRRVRGATVVWSDSTMAAQMEEFIATRRWTIHKLLYELMAAGAPVYCVADVRDLGAVEGPLLVLSPQLFTAEERAAISAYQGGPVIAVGAGDTDLASAEVEFPAGGASGLWCRIRGAAPAINCTWEAGAECLPSDLMGLPEPPLYFNELVFQPVPAGFIAACAGAIAQCARAPQVLRRGDVIRAQALELGESHLRLILGNDSHHYVVTEIDVGNAIERAEVVTAFPGTPPVVADTRFGIRVPGRGAVVVDVWLRP